MNSQQDLGSMHRQNALAQKMRQQTQETEGQEGNYGTQDNPSHTIPKDPPVERTIEQPISSVKTSTTSSIPTGLSDRIKEMEKRVGVKTERSADVEGPTNIFLDDTGNVTWYIKNVSGSHVILGDLGLKISKGAVANLREEAKIEQIEESSHLIRQLRFKNLIRLTPEQYLGELERIAESQRQLNALEAQKGIGDVTTHKTTVNKPRPLIESQLNKLDLYYQFEEDQDPNKYADEEKAKLRQMDPITFIKWIISEKFNEGEVDYMLGHPRIMSNPDIRAALLQKRKGVS